MGYGHYLSLRGTPYLVSNEHVVRQVGGMSPRHLPGRPMTYVLCNNPIQTAPRPVDVSLMRLDVEPQSPNREVVIARVSILDIVPRHTNCCIWLGFPGSTAKRHDPITELIRAAPCWRSSRDAGIPMLTQEILACSSTHREFESDKHVALHYPSRALKNLAGRAAEYFRTQKV